MNNFTIVLEDTHTLSKVCGTNDCNLKLIENHLSTPVFSRGNEIYIESEDEAIRQEFKFIIDRIMDEISVCGYGSSDMVSSILQLKEEFSADVSIAVPGTPKKIYPKSENQNRLIKAFRKSDLVFATGPAGSGKTFLAVVEALRLLLSHKVNTLILTRPVVEAGENLGFLPGDLEDKINPYLRPLYDAMNAVISKETLRKLTENGNIEIAPLAYMRGRTLNNCAVILDEAQNTTKEQMKMFLTRLGENSKMFITGDPTQIDLPKKTVSGLVNALEILQNINEISIIKMDEEDVVRSKLVKMIVKAYENGKE